LNDHVRPLTATAIINEIKKCGITHVIWLPDSRTRFIEEALAREPQITMVPVCREGEAIAVAAGLILGNRKPMILHQNTGLFESGDSVRGLGLDYRLPLLMMIGCKGWRGDTPMTDSAGIFTEPVLAAWGINSYLVDRDENASRISSAYKEAQETKRPVAILIPEDKKK
jgi:sulfopyruvate decarboxylase TPP-binding subunit